MKTVTREWLRNLIVTRNNSKAIEIRDYVEGLEVAVDKAVDLLEASGCPDSTYCNDGMHGPNPEDICEWTQELNEIKGLRSGKINTRG